MSKKKEQSIADQYRKRSQGAEIWRNFKKNKGAMLALIILILIFVIAFTIELWLPEKMYVGTNVKDRLMHPCKAHPFGTDNKGRDLFWRVLVGSRYSLSIGFVAVMVALVVGVPLGALAAYYGDKVDFIIMRITDVFASVPSILMATVVVAVLGNGTFNLMLAVGISSIPAFVKTTRAAVFTVISSEYIEAEKALGKGDLYIIFVHVLPNCLSTIIVRTTLRVASAIVSASSLSFLGLGIAPPTPEWGALLNDGKQYIRGNSYMTLFPGLAIMLTVLSFNMVGDGLRDAMDPKLKH